MSVTEIWARPERATTLGNMVEHAAQKIIEASDCVAHGDFKGEEKLDGQVDTICELIMELFDLNEEQLDEIVGHKINELMNQQAERRNSDVG